MKNSKTSTKFFIALVCFVMSIIMFQIDLVGFGCILIMTGFVLLIVGYYKYALGLHENRYARFSDTSNERIGMSIDEVRKLNSEYEETVIYEKNAPIVAVCKTCGGKVVNGVCTYCGNKYNNNEYISTLVYTSEFGEKTFTFNNGVLTNSKIVLYQQ